MLMKYNLHETKLCENCLWYQNSNKYLAFPFLVGPTQKLLMYFILAEVVPTRCTNATYKFIMLVVLLIK